jgi:predicted DNA-binding protein
MPKTLRSGGEKMESMKSTVYLNKSSQEILKRLGEQSGKGKSNIINEALKSYDESETHTAIAMQATWEQRNIEVKRIVREVIKEDLVPLLSSSTS